MLIDFGLARRSMDDAGTTGVGQVLGSPYYISPEQSQGQRVDVRTDLYSLGVMFYEMLTGQRPYGGRSAIAIMAQHARLARARPAGAHGDAAAPARSPHGEAAERPLRICGGIAGRFGTLGGGGRLTDDARLSRPRPQCSICVAHFKL